ncbi:MAG: hypothetical protein ACHQE6_01835 [Solirubrobacterales bacterium]
MGTVNRRLATDLRDQLGLRRAVETGTFWGVTARSLAALFDSVVTIELSASLHARATTALRDLPQVETVHGHSVVALSTIARSDISTLYFLDGHWSGGVTEGVEDECPVIEEIVAIGAGHPDDCLIIDDARLFTSAPSPMLDAAQWPTIIEVFDAIRYQRPDHIVTLIADQVIAVPQRAKPAIDAHGARVLNTYGARLHAKVVALRGAALTSLAAVRTRLGHHGVRP